MITKRFLLFIFLFFAAFVVLVAKLAQYQLKNYEHFLKEAISLTEKAEIVKPLRGELYDRNNILIASSIQLYKLYFDKAMIDEKEYDNIFKPISFITKNNPEVYLNKVKKSKSKIVYLEEEIDGETFTKLRDEILKLRLSCFGFEKFQKRIYSKEGVAAHVIGYVRRDSEGVDGIEKVYNDFLKGEEGILYFRKDAAGRSQGKIKEKGYEPKDGNNLQLTIDLEIQQILEEELQKSVNETKANYGVGIVLSPNTGEILALANIPSFNPSKYFEYSEEIRKNKSISVVYDPGSTFKAVTLATAIELGKIDLNTPLFAEYGSFKLPNGKYIRDDHKFSYLTPKESFVYSSNIAMAKISKLIGEEAYYKYVYNFGFGNYTGIDLPGEVRGFVSNLKKNDYTLLWMAHGYSISVTPIQLALMYAAIINGGNLLKPFLVKKIFDANGKVILENKPTIVRKVISENTSQIMREIMRSVVIEGTGKKAKLENISCGGKTGTAKKFVEKVGYSSSTYISSFVGFFPVEKPEYLIFIKIDSPRNGYYGGDIAAPVFKRVGDRIWKIKQTIQQQKAVIAQTDIDEIKEKQFPDLTGKSKISAIEIAKSFGSKIEIIGNGDVVQKQIFDRFKNKVTLVFSRDLETYNNKSKIYVPNVVGLSLREASTKLKVSGVNYKVDGSGYVVDQSVPPGEYSNSNIVVRIKCQRGI